MTGISAVGELTAERLVTETLDARDAHGQIGLDAGHLVLEQLELDSEHGRMVVSELDLDLTRDPLDFALAVGGRGARPECHPGSGRRRIGTGRFRAGNDGRSVRDPPIGGGRAPGVFEWKGPGESGFSEPVQRLLPGVPIVGSEYASFRDRLSPS